MTSTLERVIKVMYTIDDDLDNEHDVKATTRLGDLDWTHRMFCRFDATLRETFGQSLPLTEAPGMEQFETVGDLSKYIDTHLEQEQAGGTTKTAKEAKRKQVQTLQERVLECIFTVDDSAAVFGSMDADTLLTTLEWNKSQFETLEKALCIEFENEDLFDLYGVLHFSTLGDLTEHIEDIVAPRKKKPMKFKRDRSFTKILGRVIHIIHSVLPKTKKSLDKDTRLNTLGAPRILLQTSLSEEFDLPLFLETDPFKNAGSTIESLVIHIQSEFDPMSPPKKSKDTTAVPVKAFTDNWLHQHCERFTEGCISNMEFLLQLQVAPDVVAAMLHVGKLPYQAARKIEVSDLLHDDPRIEASDNDMRPQTLISDVCTEYVACIRSKLAVPHGAPGTEVSINILIGTTPKVQGQVGVAFGDTNNTPGIQWANEFLQYLLSYAGNPPQLVGQYKCELVHNIVWVTPEMLAEAKLGLPGSIHAHLK